MNATSLPYIALAVSTVACIFSVLNATAGLTNFVLSRFRLISVRDISAPFHRHVRDGEYKSFEVDILSYGAAIFDLEVKIEIFVKPSKIAIAEHYVGTTSFALTSVGPLPNPLNAGKGVKFEARVRTDTPTTHSIYFMAQMEKAFSSARSRDICVKIACSEGRKILKRLRTRDVHQTLSHFLGSKRTFRRSVNQRIRAYFSVRRMLRDQKRWGTVAKESSITTKNNGPFNP